MSYRTAARGRIVVRSLFLEALGNLNRRRMQAALSAFGIATGIAAVVVQSRSFVQTAGGGFAMRNTPRALSVQLRGVTSSGFELLNLQLASGRLPLAEEFEEGARVAVLGARIARQVFTNRDPVGEILVLGDWTFRVVGVLEYIGQPEGEFRAFQDQIIYVPFATVAAVFRGNDGRVAAVAAVEGSRRGVGPARRAAAVFPSEALRAE